MVIVERYCFEDLIRFGDDLLSHVLRRSTIGATALNGWVRDGTRCFARAMITKPNKVLTVAAAWQSAVCSKSCTTDCMCMLLLDKLQSCFYWIKSSLSMNEYQSTERVTTLTSLAYRRGGLPRLSGIPCFEGGFPLRCLQRLSCPIIATQHCYWHNNWSTSGSFTPVLSY